jgi:opacity protein-like surface antigen
MAVENGNSGLLTRPTAISTLHPSGITQVRRFEGDGEKEAGMVRIFTRASALVLAVAIAVLSLAQPAAAVDAPKWVAALFVEAQRSVGLRWMPVAGATGYKVLRSEKAGADYKEIKTSAQPQFFDQAVEPGSTYYYVLQSVAGAEVSANSDEKSVTIPGQKKQVLAAPTWVSTTVQETTEFGKTTYKAGLVWNRVPDSIAYNVYKSTTPGKDYVMLVSSAENQAIDVGVEPGKTYYYVVTALDGSFQETPFSEERKVVVEAKKEVKRRSQVKLDVKPRAAKPLWAKNKGDENGRFKFWEPFDIEVDSPRDLVYVTSNASAEVYVLKASNGEIVRIIGSKGPDPGQFLYPMGIAVTAAGEIYVVDQKRNNIQLFSAAGAFLHEFEFKLPPGEKADTVPQPMDIEVSPKTGELFVSDRGLNKIWVFDAAGTFQRFLGTPGTEVGQIAVPMYLSFDPDGNLVVINANQTRISTYDPADGKHLSSWGERKPGVGKFVFIAGMAHDAEGNVVIVDKSTNMAQGFLRDGRYLYNIADVKGEKGADLFTPKCIAIDAKNRVFIGEGLVDRVTALQLTGPVPPPQEEPLEPAAPAAP